MKRSLGPLGFWGSHGTNSSPHVFVGGPNDRSRGSQSENAGTFHYVTLFGTIGRRSPARVVLCRKAQANRVEESGG